MGGRFILAQIVPGQEIGVFTYKVRQCDPRPDGTFLIGAMLSGASPDPGGEPSSGGTAQSTRNLAAG